MIAKKKFFYMSTVIVLLLLLGAVAWLYGGKKLNAEKTLEKEYGRDFTVLEVNTKAPGQIWVIAKINQIPNHIFKMAMEIKGNDLRVMKGSKYTPCEVIVAGRIESILTNDLIDFFPDFWVRVSTSYLNSEDELFDPARATDEEIMQKLKVAVDEGGCYAEIFINETAVSYGRYEAEYEYFTKTVDRYIDEKKMFPIYVSFFKLPQEEIENLQKCARTNTDTNVYYKKLNDFNSVDFCFFKDSNLYLNDVSEYKRIREKMENE
ncbi:MAG: hypothetical protein J6X08_08975 [Lachnospiraceae bacterium]|nr:hypothetical protein [Lachnospiraceae bacterium]